jgi:hypothetical protein
MPHPPFSPRAGVALAAVLAASAFACGIVRSPDSLGARCAAGLDMLEQSRCQGDLRAQNPHLLSFELQEFKTQCKDAESTKRIAALEASCTTAQRAAVADVKRDRRKVRAQYVAEVSRLLLDPAYAPLVDRYRDLDERASHGDAAARREADAALGEFAALSAKHGIDPASGKDLQLW